MGPLVIEIDDLVGYPGETRPFSGVRRVSLHLGESTVGGPMSVEGQVAGTIDGVIAEFSVTAPIHLSCVRCLAEWDDTLEAEGTQYFSSTPDEDGYAIADRRVDVSGPATDELALAIPAAPLCRPGCRGLCPICGTDLNSAPCDGHGDDSDSPFAALKDLFDHD